MSDHEENGTLSFSLKKKEIGLKLEMEDGTERPFKLIEMDGNDRDAHINLMSSRMRYNRDGQQTGLKTVDKIQADLISRCLVDSDGNCVPVNMIQKWPSSVQTGLYEVAVKLNGLDRKAEEEAGND